MKKQSEKSVWFEKPSEKVFYRGGNIQSCKMLLVDCEGRLKLTMMAILDFNKNTGYNVSQTILHSWWSPSVSNRQLKLRVESQSYFMLTLSEL